MKIAETASMASLRIISENIPYGKSKINTVPVITLITIHRNTSLRKSYPFSGYFK